MRCIVFDIYACSKFSIILMYVCFAFSPRDNLISLIDTCVTVYWSIIVGDLVKLHSCICRCELIELSRRVFYARVCVRKFGQLSGLTRDVTIAAHARSPVGRSVDRRLPVATHAHSFSQLIVPRHLLSHARLSSCPPGALRAPWSGQSIHESWSAVRSTTRVWTSRCFTSGFILCLSFSSELVFRCSCRRYFWGQKLGGEPIVWQVAHRPLSFLFRIIKLRRVN